MKNKKKAKAAKDTPPTTTHPRGMSECYECMSVSVVSVVSALKIRTKAVHVVEYYC